MKQKMHLYLIILALTVLGVASQQQTTVANQELVLHFTHIEASSQEAEHTITQLQDQLLELGVKNIQVKNDERGKLIIRYYSDLDVSSIRQTLVEESILNLNFPENDFPLNENLPLDNDVAGYNLDIFEIQNGSDSSSGFDGCIVIKKLESDRYYDPNTLYSFYCVQNKNENLTTEVSLKIWRNIQSSIDNVLYVIPEVRAGPNTIRKA